MRRDTYLFCVCLGFCAVILVVYYCSNRVSAKSDDGSLSVVPNVARFGEMNQSATQRQKIEIRNTSQKRIKLVGLTGSCSCSASNFQSGELNPGDIQSNTISFSSGRKRGHYEDILRLQFEIEGDPEIRTLPIPLTATIRPQFEFVPSQVDLSDSVREIEMALRCHYGSDDVHISQVSCNSNLVRVQILDRLRLRLLYSPTQHSLETGLSCEYFATIQCADHDTITIPVTML